MKKEEEILYFDPNRKEWKVGDCGVNIKIKKGTAICISLPFMIDSMYPTDKSDLFYATCCKCGKSLSKGQLCIEFDDLKWGIRIRCNPKKIRLISTNILIVNVHHLVASIIERGWQTPSNDCNVCSRPKCKDEDCKKIIKDGMLNITATEELLEFFYKIRLNVLSPLVDYKCIYCSKKSNHVCTKCKSVVICDRCKKKKKEGHECKEFENMWRVY